MSHEGQDQAKQAVDRQVSQLPPDLALLFQAFRAEVEAGKQAVLATTRWYVLGAVALGQLLQTASLPSSLSTVGLFSSAALIVKAFLLR